jgi:ATP-dependent RNA helicase DDX54/DBP10
MSKKLHAASTTSDLDIEVSGSSSLSDDDENSGPEHPFDISSALTRRKTSLQKGKAPLVPREHDVDDDTELEEMIRNSISRRNAKDGTELLKNTKGKKKLTKGEVGGGSFQSMGMATLSFSPILFWRIQ